MAEMGFISLSEKGQDLVRQSREQLRGSSNGPRFVEPDRGRH